MIYAYDPVVDSTIRHVTSLESIEHASQLAHLVHVFLNLLKMSSEKTDQTAYLQRMVQHSSSRIERRRTPCTLTVLWRFSLIWNTKQKILTGNRRSAETAPDGFLECARVIEHLCIVELQKKIKIGYRSPWCSSLLQGLISALVVMNISRETYCIRTCSTWVSLLLYPPSTVALQEGQIGVPSSSNAFVENSRTEKIRYSKWTNE